MGGKSQAAVWKPYFVGPLPFFLADFDMPNEDTLSSNYIQGVQIFYQDNRKYNNVDI